MNIRKYLALIVSGGVTATAAAVLGFLLIRHASEYAGVSGRMDSSNRRLQTLGGQARFPNEDNVRRAGENLERIEAFFRESMAAFLKNQRKIPAMEPARFPQALQRFVLSLNQAAVSNGVATPPRFLYGFERYARGQPPAKSDVPRLLRQSNAIEEILRILFENRIRQLMSIERHVFEDERPRAAEEENAGDDASMDAKSASAGYVKDPSGLFEKERIIFTFVTREAAFWAILNALPALPLFCTVADIEIANEAPKPSPVNPADGSRRTPGTELAGDAAAAPAAPAAPPAPGAPIPRPPKHEERTVAGLAEPLKIRLAVDVYTFLKPASDTPAEEAQP